VAATDKRAEDVHEGIPCGQLAGCKGLSQSCKAQAAPYNLHSRQRDVQLLVGLTLLYNIFKQSMQAAMTQSVKTRTVLTIPPTA
jgi:hypothetical protein